MVGQRLQAIRGTWSSSASCPVRMGLLVGVVLLAGCERRPAGETATVEPTAVGDPDFLDRTDQTGLEFTHANGMQGQRAVLEILGAGGGLVDYDDDGDLDLFLRQGRFFWSGSTSGGLGTRFAGHGLGDRLFRNDLESPGSSPHWIDVTTKVLDGPAAPQDYGMGVIVADFDRDGHDDLFLTNYGTNRILFGGQDGGFRERPSDVGVGDNSWSTAASVLDFDRDGWLDLFVGNYVDLNAGNHQICGDEDYCGPLTFRAQSDQLLRNRGDGTFEDVTVGAGLVVTGRTLGSVVLDYDRDGWSDIYVANDASENLLWHNLGDGTFEEQALQTGAALNAAGAMEGSMGVDAADIDGDGWDDLVMAHIGGESNTLYLNQGGLLFLDRSAPTGLGGPSLPYTGFGLRWFDLELDGRLDLFVANGAVNRDPLQVLEGLALPLREPNQLLVQGAGGRFEDVSARSPALIQPEVSRGAVFGDLDNDGDTDIVVTNNGSRAQLLLNQRGNGKFWLGVRLTDETGRRDVLGAEARLWRSASTFSSRRVHVDGGYLSSHDPRVVFGLGDDPAVERLEVRWPDGLTEIWDDLVLGQYQTLRRGSGKELR